MSASIICVGTYTAGMIISVSENIGKVLRVDTITNISKTAPDEQSTELEKITRKFSDLFAFPFPNKPKKSVDQQRSLSSILSQEPVEALITFYKMSLKLQWYLWLNDNNWTSFADQKPQFNQYFIQKAVFFGNVSKLPTTAYQL